MKIIGSLPSLRRVELELLKPSVADRYLPHLLRLRNLDAINLAGFHTFNEDHFKQITEAATVLTEFSFPTGTPWAQKEYLIWDSNYKISERLWYLWVLFSLIRYATLHFCHIVGVI